MFVTITGLPAVAGCRPLVVDRRRPLDPTAVAIGLCGVGGCALTPHGPKVRHTWERT